MTLRHEGFIKKKDYIQLSINLQPLMSHTHTNFSWYTWVFACDTNAEKEEKKEKDACTMYWHKCDTNTYILHN